MDYRKILKDEYKRTPPKRGIYIIHNLSNKKIFVGSSLNVEARINRFRFELVQGMHKNKELQTDFELFGETNFTFEIAELIKEKEQSYFDYSSELEDLEKTWIEKIQPFGDRGYNS